MSLIKKISEIVDRGDNVDARKNITRLNKDIRNYKEKVKHYIESNYKEFLPSIVSNEQLLEEGSKLEDELFNTKQSLNTETSAMHEANDEISKYVEDLQEVQVKLKLSMKLVKIDRCMEKIRQLNEAKSYSEVNGYVNKVQLLIDDPDDKIFRKLEIYQHLKIRLTLERKRLLKNLENQFKSLIQLKEKSFHKTKAITMSITKDLEALSEVTHSILDSEFDFKDIADFMMVNIFEPLVSRAVSLEFVENDNNFTTNLSYSTGPISDDLRPNYANVFVNFSNLLYFLMNMNFELNNGEYLVPFILKNRYDDLMKMILNECLMHSIPNTFEERSQSTLINDIGNLNKILTEQLFFSPGNEKLEDYPAEIDRIFYKQFIKNITSKSSDILKRDLHDMLAISEDTTISTTTPLTFPRSMISKSTLELIRLLEKIITEAQKCDDASKEKKQNLLLAVKAVLEDYPFSIQLHHSKFMSQIPQQAALFYNNCMYLSNWVNNNQDTLGIPGIEQVTKGLESQGYEILEVQIAKQKVQMIEVLSEFDPSQALNVVNPEVFKPIRQCLRQMDLLKNVWQTILPSNLYNKTMSGLLNVISSNFVNKVAVMEDISSNLSTALVELIKTIDEKSQALFEADTSCLTVVDSWQRLMHLQFILDASLIDISSSWKSAQLSKSFSAEDVRRLIRALFQNTERRAAALSLIV